MNNKDIFSNKKINKSTIKYFVIAFSVFIVLLAVCSVVLFMSSLDFDLNNLVENTTVNETDNASESTTEQYSVNTLKGKSTILFIVENDDGKVDFLCVASNDFDNKKMTVDCIDGNEELVYSGVKSTVSDVYSTDYEIGLNKSLLETFSIEISKYVIFKDDQLDDVLELFDSFTVNVKNSVNYKSTDFNLKLDVGKQELSSDLTYKYLIISDNATRKSIICDIINSVLIPEYADNSQKLFTSFVNLCKTDISVIDYSNAVDNLIVYSYSNDKFLPNGDGEK